jgi:hypothetical protein
MKQTHDIVIEQLPEGEFQAGHLAVTCLESGFRFYLGTPEFYEEFCTNPPLGGPHGPERARRVLHERRRRVPALPLGRLPQVGAVMEKVHKRGCRCGRAHGYSVRILAPGRIDLE